HAREPDGEVVYLDHAEPSGAFGLRRNGREISRPRLPRPWVSCWEPPPGAVRRTCSSPAPKMISSQFESTFHWVWRMKGTSIMKTPARTGPTDVKITP